MAHNPQGLPQPSNRRPGLGDEMTQEVMDLRWEVSIVIDMDTHAIAVGELVLEWHRP